MAGTGFSGLQVRYSFYSGSSIGRLGDRVGVGWQFWLDSRLVICTLTRTDIEKWGGRFFCGVASKRAASGGLWDIDCKLWIIKMLRCTTRVVRVASGRGGACELNWAKFFAEGC